MPNELKLQSDIVKSVRRDGGYARKLTNRFTIGIPDLVILLPKIAPFFAEVKDLGECNDTFNRQLAVSPKQRHELKIMNSVYGSPIAVLLVGLKHQGQHRLICLPALTERVTHAYTLAPRSYGSRGAGGYYDLKRLLGVAR